MGGEGRTVPRRHSVSSSGHLTSFNIPREQRRDNHHSIYSPHLPFNLPQPLAGHQKGIPNSRGSHICQFCSRRFILSSDLTRHIRIHTGEKPFQCPFCDHRTARKFSLDKHIFNMHTPKNTPASDIMEELMLSSTMSVSVNESSNRDTEQDNFTTS
ncbi:unnamed protein product [Meganyctiphanes norvegica]|uniref:C2H2-type domain-containing protein n=1 Tax=Meganyctiphanes norvegica TaxID=48144 RepID=A0AAV2Q3Z5_MEGNR